MAEHRNYTAISEFRVINRRKLLKCPDLNHYLKISVSPDSTMSNEEYLTVTVSGVVTPSSSDWVAMISPSSSNVTDCPLSEAYYAQTGDLSDLPLLCQYPVKAQYVSNDPDYLNCTKKECQKRVFRRCVVATCSGSLTFHVINIRTNIEFVFFAGGFDTPCILTWLLLLPSPAKDFGWHDPGFIHTAVMIGLQPSSTFSYRYGSDSIGWSNQTQFRTPPAGGSDGLYFIVYGDMGKTPFDSSVEHYIQPGSLSVIKAVTDEVNSVNVDSIFHIGDISYATGFLVEWDFFLELINPVASQVTYMTAIGNHERDYVDSGLGMAMGRYGSGFTPPRSAPTHLETRPKNPIYCPAPSTLTDPDPDPDPKIRLSRFSRSPWSRITEAARRSPRTRRVGVGPSSSALLVFHHRQDSERIVDRPCPMNHGAEVALVFQSQIRGECGVAYETYFPMPTPAKDKPWYSIEQASVHFTVISTEHDWSVNSEQAQTHVYFFKLKLQRKAWPVVTTIMLRRVVVAMEGQVDDVC
uniref:Purple acid phosphatase n=1 Tax=Fagus sylvatica TaxID=28930 RepID=A0A2N9EUX1_FAGSY